MADSLPASESDDSPARQADAPGQGATAAGANSAVPGTAPAARPAPPDSAAARLLALDLRSLAAFRIGLGLVLLLDLAFRSPDLVAHYTDHGVLPRRVRVERFGSGDVGLPFPISPYEWSGEAWLPGLLFALTAVCAVWLLIGYRTLLATFAC
jgi:hypothetical protein